MTITPELIQQVVREVVREVTQGTAGSSSTTGFDGVFDDMDAAVEAAAAASAQYLGYSMRDRARFVQVIRDIATVPEHLEYMAAEAVSATGMGNVTDKIAKNRAAALFTPGTEDIVTEAWSGDDGLTTVEVSPYGVIGAITPTTNPTETVVCNSIGMLAAGNAVVFSPHPRATNLTHWLVDKLNKGLVAAGAPRNLIVTVSKPSIENTNAMIAHPQVRMLVATGGPGIVKAVLSSGKKAIGAGAGNPPVIVDETADIEKAAEHIVNGSSFDNNLPCTSEKELVAVDCIADLLMFEMVKHGAYQVTDQAIIDKLVALLVNGRHPVTDWVGKPAAQILAAVGVQAPVGTRLVIADVPRDHPFVVTELMMPVLGVVRVKDVDEAIAVAIKLEHGNRHSAMMHSANVNALTKAARLLQTTVFVKNGPSYAGLGIGGEGYTTFTIAGPTGEGLTSARHFCRRRRCVLVGGLNVR